MYALHREKSSIFFVNIDYRKKIAVKLCDPLPQNTADLFVRKPETVGDEHIENNICVGRALHHTEIVQGQGSVNVV